MPESRPRTSIRRFATPRGVLVPASFLTAAVALHGHVWSDPGHRRISGNPNDIDHYAWWLVWGWHALRTGHNPLLTHAMNAPLGVNAMSNTSMPLPAAALGWLTQLAGPLVVYNVLSTLAPALSAGAGYLCGRRLGLPPAAAYAAGLAFGFSPAVVNSLVGHVTMALDPLLPIIVLLAVGAVTGARPRRSGLLLGAAAVEQLLIGEEVLLEAGLSAVLALAVLAASHPGRVAGAARRGARALGWALAVFVPLAAYPLWLQFFGPLRAYGSPFLRDYFAADLLGFVTPTQQVWLHSAGVAVRAAGFPGGLPEQLAYLGVPLLLVCLAVAGLRFRRDVRVRVASVGLLVFATLSLGGRLWVDGRWTHVALPWGLVEDLPVLEHALASRFGVPAAMFAAALLGLAVEAAGRRTNRPVALAVAACAVVPLLPRPLAGELTAPIPRYFSTAARQLPADSTVLVLPYPTPTVTEPMRWQAAAEDRFQMPGGYFLGPAGDGHVYVGGDVPAPTARLLIQVAETGAAPGEVSAAQRAQARADLAFWRVDRIVLGPCPHRSAVRRTVDALVGRRSARQAGVDVWFPLPGAGG